MLIDLDTSDSGIIFYGSREEFYAENEEDARQWATLIVWLPAVGSKMLKHDRYSQHSL